MGGNPVTRSEALEAATFFFSCPKCGKTASYALKNEGKPFICPKCKADITSSPELKTQIGTLKVTIATIYPA
jgi:predicted RNA-binding Zn-ribbon protein involved in translation (DUF1610 family)